jgi:predicted RNA-binding protein associated with RNAse of E/G family
MPHVPAVDLHRPKVEYFHVADLTNIDPKGFARPVDQYHVRPWGLYMARAADHQQFHYVESWLLPALDLRATVFHFNPGHRRDQDYYLDIGQFGEVEPGTWRSVDHYLDIVVRTGRGTELLDIDELLAAHAAGYLDLDESCRAVHTAYTAIDGIAGHGYDFERWLGSLGIDLTWK